MTETPTAAPVGQEAVPGLPRAEAKPDPAKKKHTLYAPREPIYPKLVHGKFRRMKWILMIVTLGIYYGLPWIRWDRGPGLPDQAVLLDFAHQRLYFFGLEIWAQEFYYVTGILILSALALFLVTALAGRVWCGYACPQTVWTDLMILVERLWQGDRNARMKLAKAPWSFNKAWRLTGTHLSWLLIGVATGARLSSISATRRRCFPNSGISTRRPWLMSSSGFSRRRPIHSAGSPVSRSAPICAPGRAFRGRCSTPNSLLITYRGFRGEPRGAHKKGDSWEGRGDCVDCGQCVAVCPAGIDIRNGSQLECIQCALCIDACDEIMAKVGRPAKLIAYDTYRNLQEEAHGGRVPIRLVRPRTLLYAGLFALVVCLMLFGLSQKTVLDVNVVPDRNPLFVQLQDGGIRNGYTVRLMNKRQEPRSFKLSIDGMPEAKIAIVGVDGDDPLIEVKSDDLRSLKAYVTIPPSNTMISDNNNKTVLLNN